MILVLLAEGFEELEALTPVDILRREGYEVRTVGVTGCTVTGTHGITVTADLSPEEADEVEIEAVIFPGGMPGALNLDASELTNRLIDKANASGAHLAAICAAPLIFGRRGMLVGKRAVCFPGFENELTGATVVNEPVVTDGGITTARDFRCAVAFADRLAEIMRSRAAVPEEFVLPDSFEEDMDEVSTLPDCSLLSRGEPTPVCSGDQTALEGAILSILSGFEIGVEIPVVMNNHGFYTFVLECSNEADANRILNLERDIQIGLAREGVRVKASDEKTRIFVEVPIQNGGSLSLGDIASTRDFSNSKISFPIGEDRMGNIVYSDLDKMAHMIINGSIGSGKSVLVNTVLLSLLYKNTENEVKLILIDPKRNELTTYKNIPHLLCPIITEASDAVGAMLYAMQQTERRFEMFDAKGVSSFDEYNATAEEGDRLPRIILVVEEFSDLTAQIPDVFSSFISDLAQRSSEVGIHMLLSSRTPLEGEDSASAYQAIPTRIALNADNPYCSKRTIGIPDAIDLVRGGDMLCLANGITTPVRMKAVCVSDDDVLSTTEFIRQSWGRQTDREIYNEMKILSEDYLNG